MAGTIADKLNYLKWTKSDIRDAIIEKGVDVPADLPFRQYADKIDAIQTGGSASKYGIAPENIIGSLSNDGVLNAPTTFTLDLTGVKEAAKDVLSYRFYQNQYLVGLVAPDLKTAQMRSFENGFSGSSLSGDVTLPNLTKASEQAFARGFSNTRITRFIAPKLSEVEDGAFNSAFLNCAEFIEAQFPMLMKASGYAFWSAFAGTAITSMSFPALGAVSNSVFGVSASSYAFSKCVQLKEIHFLAAMQSKIEAMDGYADKWGAPADCQILFDL